MKGAEWWVLGGAALAGWAVVSWLFPTRKPDGASASQPVQPPDALSLPKPAEAPPATAHDVSAADATFESSAAAGDAGLSLTEIAARWHLILGVAPDASLADIEVAWQQRRAAGVDLARLREAYDFARRLKS